jgi:hypothetical protein
MTSLFLENRNASFRLHCGQPSFHTLEGKAFQIEYREVTSVAAAAAPHRPVISTQTNRASFRAAV